MELTNSIDHVKGIPGYKLILTTVIKGQIQQLIEQLSCYSEEECVLLSVDTSSGNVTHCGSQNGKSFIEDHGDVQTRFLQFCLQGCHPTQVDEDLHRNHGSILNHHTNLVPKIFKLDSSTSGDNRTRTNSSTRHKPYLMKRPRNKLNSQNAKPAQSHLSTDSDDVCIKVEPTQVSLDQISDEIKENKSDLCELDNLSNSSAKAFFLEDHSKTSFDENDASDDVGTQVLDMNEEIEESLAHVSEITRFNNDNTASSNTRTDSNCMQVDRMVDNVDVKVEPDNLEVKVEPTSTSTSKSDGTGKHAANKGASSMKIFACDICGKPFPSKWEFSRHRRTHTGEKPFQCQFCFKAFADKSNMTQHVKNVHYRKPIRRETIRKSFNL